MSKYLIKLDNLSVKSDQINDIFTFDGDYCNGLNKESYINVICSEILKQFMSTVNVKYGRDKGKIIVIYMYCVLKQCTRAFKIKIEKHTVKKNESANFEVSSTENDCDHREKVIRQLRGNERRMLAEKIKSTSISSFRSDAIIDSDKESLSKGNLQTIYTKPVLRKALSEKKCENDFHSNPLFDLVMQINNFKFVHSVDFKKERFNVILLSSKQISSLKTYLRWCRENNQISRLHFDATGGVLASPDDDISNLFHHIIVFPWKFNKIDNKCSFMNVGEMISALHTSDQQEIFLRRFIQLASKQIKQDGTKISLQIV